MARTRSARGRTAASVAGTSSAGERIRTLEEENAELKRLNEKQGARIRLLESQLSHASPHDEHVQDVVEEEKEVVVGDAQGEEWRLLLSTSDIATKHIHSILSPGWVEVLMQACCVRPSDREDKRRPGKAAKRSAKKAKKKKKKVTLRLEEDLDDAKKFYDPSDFWSFGEMSKACGGCMRGRPFRDLVVYTRSLSMLKWCVAHGYKPIEETWCGLARKGDKKSLEFLLRHREKEWGGCAGCSNARMETFPMYARPDLRNISTRVCTVAATFGHGDIFKRFQELGGVVSSYEIPKFAKHNDLDMLKYCFEHHMCDLWFDEDHYAYVGGQREYSLCCLAASAGNMEMLQWLVGKGFPLRKETMRHAVEAGHAQVLQ